jgi:hypothetical protein
MAFLYDGDGKGRLDSISLVSGMAGTAAPFLIDQTTNVDASLSHITQVHNSWAVGNVLSKALLHTGFALKAENFAIPSGQAGLHAKASGTVQWTWQKMASTNYIFPSSTTGKAWIALPVAVVFDGAATAITINTANKPEPIHLLSRTPIAIGTIMEGKQETVNLAFEYSFPAADIARVAGKQATVWMGFYLFIDLTGCNEILQAGNQLSVSSPGNLTNSKLQIGLLSDFGPSPYVSHGGDLKKAKEVYVSQGGQLKKAKEMYVSNGGQLKKVK